MSDASVRARRVSTTSIRPTAERQRWHVALAALTLLVAAVPFGLRLLRNVPGTNLAAATAVYETVVLAATLGPALAAVALAVTVVDLVERVSLLTLAVFSPLALLADAAYLPAAAAVTVAGGVVAWRRLDRGETIHSLPWAGRYLLAGATTAAVGGSLAATVGLAPVVVHQSGTMLALVAAVAVALATDSRRIDWAAGALAASLVYAAGTTAPYVTGAVALVVGGAVGVSLPLLAAGIGGIVAASVTSLRRGAFVPACGALMLLVGGVPVTVPRALVVTLGVAFVLGGELA